MKSYAVGNPTHWWVLIYEQKGKVLWLDSVAYNGSRGRQGKTLEKSVLHQVSGITNFPQKGHERQCHWHSPLFFNHAQSYLPGSEWYKINDTGKTNSDGKDLRHVIHEIMDVFPCYKLGSKKGLRQAEHEMREKLAEVLGRNS